MLYAICHVNKFLLIPFDNVLLIGAYILCKVNNIISTENLVKS